MEKKEYFGTQKEKIKFLREQCNEERSYFLAFAESHLNAGIKDAEFEIEGYSHVRSHSIRRIGGGVIIYISNELTYQNIVTASDEMCSLVGIYINTLNMILFMAYRPPPNHKSQYHGDILEQSFKNIVIDNVRKVMHQYKTPTPDIILAGDFNFPKASWEAGIGRINPDCISN